MHIDAQLVSGFADLQVRNSFYTLKRILSTLIFIQVKMYAEFATSRLIDFLRASSSYNLEMVSFSLYS